MIIFVFAIPLRKWFCYAFLALLFKFVVVVVFTIIVHGSAEWISFPEEMSIGIVAIWHKFKLIDSHHIAQHLCRNAFQIRSHIQMHAHIARVTVSTLSHHHHRHHLNHCTVLGVHVFGCNASMRCAPSHPPVNGRICAATVKCMTKIHNLNGQQFM